MATSFVFILNCRRHGHAFNLPGYCIREIHGCPEKSASKCRQTCSLFDKGNGIYRWGRQRTPKRLSPSRGRKRDALPHLSRQGKRYALPHGTKAPLCKGGSPEGGGGLFPKTLFFGAVSDYELPNSRAVPSERLLPSINPSAALNGRHLPLHKGGFGTYRTELRTVYVACSGTVRNAPLRTAPYSPLGRPR